MPVWIRTLGLVGNAIVAAFFLLGGLWSLAKGGLGVAIFFWLVAGVAGFSWYVIRKAARLLSEEEWLKAEIRKTALRRQLAAMQAEPSQPADDQPRRIEGPKA